jgi:intraflagellar transport protein 80
MVAVIDRSDSKVVRLFDIATGRALQHSISHMMEINELSLCAYGQGSERKIAVIDRNRDLYVRASFLPSFVPSFLLYAREQEKNLWFA